VTGRFPCESSPLLFMRCVFCLLQEVKRELKRIHIGGYNYNNDKARAKEKTNICVVYYETIKRELNKRLIYECRCDARLKAKAEGSPCHAYTGLREGLEHLKIETKLINERFASVMGECVTLTPQALRQYSK
jgi:hypothetical protein